MAEKYEPEKWIWTEADFENMSWHDATIHALAFVPDGFEFVLDIDYVLQWVNPLEGDTYYKFQVAPATLVFENVHDLQLIWSLLLVSKFKTFIGKTRRSRRMLNMWVQTRNGVG